MSEPDNRVAAPMGMGRLEAFSDGVIAIIITIMVLELKTPAGHDWASLAAIWPVLFVYALSFVYVGIYWSNHHHTLHAARHASGGVLWANLHLLFWLSLIPFTTRWMGESGYATVPVAVYGLSLLGPSIAYYVLSRVLIAVNPDSLLARAVGWDVKGMVSTALYVVGIALTFWQPLAGIAVYVLVALIWLVPDRRIERAG